MLTQFLLSLRLFTGLASWRCEDLRAQIPAQWVGLVPWRTPSCFASTVFVQKLPDLLPSVC